MTTQKTVRTPTNRRRIAFGFVLIGGALTGLLVWLLAAEQPTPQLLFGRFRFREFALIILLALSLGGLACLSAGRQILVGYLACLIPLGLIIVFAESLSRIGLLDLETLLSPAAAAEEPGPGWTLQPNIVVTGETRQDIAVRYGLQNDPIPFEFKTDAYGFRNEPGSKGEIVILGDSIVVGAAVPAEATIAEVVEERVGRPVVQAALLGTSIQRQHEFLIGSGLPLEGRKVIQFLFEGNDLLDSRNHRIAPDDQAAGASPRDTSFLRFLWTRLVRLTNPEAPYHSCDIAGQVYAFLWTQQSFADLEGEVEPITQAISDFRSELETVGADYALVFVPTKYRVLHELCTFPPASKIAHPADNLSGTPTYLAAWASEAAISFLDLTPQLKAAARAGEIPWFWGDTHWNEVGHRVAGEAVARWLH
jgi:hypothetical protein